MKDSINPKKIIVLIAILAAVTLLFISFYNYKTAEQRELAAKASSMVAYNKAKSYFGNADYDLAILHYNIALEANPDNPVLLTELALAYEYSGNFPYALNSLKRALAINPTLFSAYLVLADIYIKQNQYEEAIKTLKKALVDFEADAKDRIIAYNLIGYAYLQTGELEKAYGYLSKALELSSSYVDARTNLGLYYLKKNDLNQAVEQFKTAINLNKNYIPAHYYLAYVLYMKNDRPKALKQLEQINHISPNYYKAYFLAGKIYTEADSVNKAVNNFTKMLKIDTFEWDTSDINTYFKNTITLLNILKNKHPRKLEIYDLISTIHIRNGEYDKAIKNYEEAIKNGVDYPTVHNNLAVIYLQDSKKTKAIEEYQKAIKKKPKEPIFVYNLAVLYKDKNDVDKATEHFNKVLKIDPNFYLADVSLADIYKEQGELEKALEFYKKALKITPSYPHAHLMTGEIYLKQGKKEQALTSYRDYIKFAKESEQKKQVLAIIKDLEG